MCPLGHTLEEDTECVHWVTFERKTQCVHWVTFYRKTQNVSSWSHFEEDTECVPGSQFRGRHRMSPLGHILEKDTELTN